MPAADQSQAAVGDLVGFIDAGRSRLAVVTAVRGSKAELKLDGSARQIQRGLRQIDLIARLPEDLPPPHQPSQAPWKLSEATLAAALPAARERAAAWLLLCDEPSPLELGAFVSVLGDGDDPVQRAACWRWLQGEQLLFRWKHRHVEPRPADELRRLRRQRHHERLQQQRRLHWQQTLRTRQPIDASRLEASELQHLDLLRCWAAGDCDSPLPDDLRRDLQATHCAAESGAIRHLLVELGQWERHHLPSLDRTTWDEGFRAELLAEADRLIQAADGVWPGDEDRLDLCHLHVVTIDDEDTQDIDDGLALESVDGRDRLWIHVADPGRLVPEGSPLDLEARRRGASLYLARGSLPMFPPALSTGPFSLRMGMRCPAWSVWVEFEAEGAVESYGIERSWIRPTYRLTYDDGDELIELAPPEERQLACIEALLSRRRRWRAARGALQLDQPEGRIRCLNDDACLEISEPSRSRAMVAEAMILAGAVVAEHGSRHALALPYRSQPPAELPPQDELDRLPPGPVRHAAIKRCLQRGHVGTTPAAHFSLGLQAYVQATSPIRRYGDLVVQRQLLAFRNGADPMAEPELGHLLSELEGPVRQGIQISREDQRHWQQVWFEQHHQPEWRAVFLRWLREQHQLGLVHVEELAMDLAAECPPGSEPSDDLLLRVRQVDSLRDQLQLVAVR